MSPSRDMEDGFKEVVAAIADVLKPHDFKKKGRTWTRRCDTGWTRVEVQRSQWNDGDGLTFYVDLVASADGLSDDAPPFSERLGGSWDIKPSTDATRLAKKVRRALEKDGVPLLEEVSGAEGLRDHWLGRLDDGATPLSDLLTLLEKVGPKGRVGEVKKLAEERRAERERSAAEDG